MKINYLWDKQNELQMTAGYLPKVDEMDRVLARSPISRKLEEHAFMKSDTYHAWRLTAEAQRLAAYHGFDPRKLELQTWLIAPNPSVYQGRFGPCFFGQSPQSTYRLMIHRTKRILDGDPLDVDVWGRLAELQLVRYSEPPSEDFSGGANLLMEEMLEAYQREDQDVDRVLSVIGHHYFHSKGFEDDPAPESGISNHSPSHHSDIGSVNHE